MDAVSLCDSHPDGHSIFSESKLSAIFSAFNDHGCGKPFMFLFPGFQALYSSPGFSPRSKLDAFSSTDVSVNLTGIYLCLNFTSFYTSCKVGTVYPLFKRYFLKMKNCHIYSLQGFFSDWCVSDPCDSIVIFAVFLQCTFKDTYCTASLCLTLSVLDLGQNGYHLYQSPAQPRTGENDAANNIITALVHISLIWQKPSLTCRTVQCSIIGGMGRHYSGLSDKIKNLLIFFLSLLNKAWNLI